MRAVRAALILSLAAAACADEATTPAEPIPSASAPNVRSGVVMVTSAADAGPGSLRAAFMAASADPSIRAVQVRPGLTIELHSSLEYSGSQSLFIHAHGAILDGAALPAGATNLRAFARGDLEISDLTVQNAPGHGLVVQIPADESGTKTVVLNGVTALDNLGHGVEINDQEDPDDAGDSDAGIRGNSNGSDASLDVRVYRSVFEGNGFGALDRDGLRVNEGGLGDLRFEIVDSRADANGADGVELDERGEGSLAFRIFRSHFSRNGDYDQSADPDKDDGFDADETDAGDFIADVMLSTANDNFEEGFDFNENDAGDQIVTIKLSEASGNTEEGIDLEEDDDWQGGGDLIAVLDRVVANGNTTVDGNGGIKIRERGDGDLDARIEGSTASENVEAGIHLREQHGGDLRTRIVGALAERNGDTGIFVREDDAGSQDAEVSGSRSLANGEHGIDFDENGDGDLAARVRFTTASDNAEYGIRADEGGAGAGTLSLQTVTLDGNGSPGTTGNVTP